MKKVKNSLRIFLFIMIFAAAGFFYAGGAVYAESLKIGFVDMNVIAERSLAGKAIMEGFQKEGLKRQSEIDEMKKRLEDLRMELEKQGMLLSDKARKEKEDQFLKEKRKLERFFSDSSEEFDRKKAESERQFLDKIVRLTKKVGKKEGYSVILGKQFLLFASDSIDLTDHIIEKIDEGKIN